LDCGLQINVVATQFFAAVWLMKMAVILLAQRRSVMVEFTNGAAALCSFAAAAAAAAASSVIRRMAFWERWGMKASLRCDSSSSSSHCSSGFRRSRSRSVDG
jgi:hypothetical protein